MASIETHNESGVERTSANNVCSVASAKWRLDRSRRHKSDTGERLFRLMDSGRVPRRCCRSRCGARHQLDGTCAYQAVIGIGCTREVAQSRRIRLIDWLCARSAENVHTCSTDTLPPPNEWMGVVLPMITIKLPSKPTRLRLCATIPRHPLFITLRTGQSCIYLDTCWPNTRTQTHTHDK